MIKKIAKIYMDSKILPIGTIFFSLIIFSLLFLMPGYNSLIDILLNLLAIIVSSIFFLSFISLFFISIRSFKQGKKVRGVLNLVYIILTIIITTICFFSLIVFTLFFPGQDNFGKDIKIPENIIINNPKNIPINIGTFNTDVNETPFEPVKNNDFEIYNGFQGGLYYICANIAFHEDGHVYLKAFEVTKNIPLSEYPFTSSEALHKKTLQYVDRQDFNPSCTYKVGMFTIYEGDWGTYYPARFELWFKGISNEQEYKLLEKNYLIQGWER